MSVDVLALWNFGDAKGSETAFRAAMEGANPVDRAILRTQVARALGLQGRATEATEELATARQAAPEDPEVQARYQLESGRILFSAAHDPAKVSDADKTAAKDHYDAAFTVADAAGLGYLAVDALHMLAIVQPDAEAQIAADLRAVAYMESSLDPEASKWEASLRHNLGYALHLAGRDDEAIVQYQNSLIARERAGNWAGVRIAKWMIARSLRAKGELTDALAMQTALKDELDAIGETDEYVEEEIRILTGLLDAESAKGG